jgi:hypothetical protein
MMRNPNRKPRERGAASVEAVVALPVFVILFSGVFFVRELTGAKLDAAREARRCAWEYSANGCDAIPDGCGGVVARSPRESFPESLAGAWEDTKNSVSEGKYKQAFLNVLTKSVSDAIVAAFTLSLDAEKVEERAQPPLFGGGKTLVPAKYHLACNLKDKSKEQIVEEVWNFLIP